MGMASKVIPSRRIWGLGRTNRARPDRPTFDTRKEAVTFRESLRALRDRGPRSRDIRTVEQGLQKWLDVCEKEGRNGGDPVTNYTLKNHQW